MLLYSLKLTPAHKRVMDECFRQGTPLPKSLQHAPTLNRGLQLYYDAFWQLHTCRQLGEVQGPIPWHHIDMWCQRHGLEGEAAADLHYHVERLDFAYLEHCREAQAAAMAQAKSKAKVKAPPGRRTRVTR